MRASARGGGSVGGGSAGSVGPAEAQGGGGLRVALLWRPGHPGRVPGGYDSRGIERILR